MSERDRELNHGTWRVALVAGAAVLIGTSTAFESDVWHVMLTIIVCVCVLGPLAGWFLWLNHRAGGTWRPRERRQVTRTPARSLQPPRRPAALDGKRDIEVIASRPRRRGELQRGKVGR